MDINETVIADNMAEMKLGENSQDDMSEDENHEQPPEKAARQRKPWREAMGHKMRLQMKLMKQMGGSAPPHQLPFTAAPWQAATYPFGPRYGPGPTMNFHPQQPVMPWPAAPRMCRRMRGPGPMGHGPFMHGPMWQGRPQRRPHGPGCHNSAPAVDPWTYMMMFSGPQNFGNMWKMANADKNMMSGWKKQGKNKRKQHDDVNTSGSEEHSDSDTKNDTEEQNGGSGNSDDESQRKQDCLRRRRMRRRMMMQMMQNPNPFLIPWMADGPHNVQHGPWCNKKKTAQMKQQDSESKETDVEEPMTGLQAEGCTTKEKNNRGRHCKQGCPGKRRMQRIMMQHSNPCQMPWMAVGPQSLHSACCKTRWQKKNAHTDEKNSNDKMIDREMTEDGVQNEENPGEKANKQGKQGCPCRRRMRQMAMMQNVAPLMNPWMVNGSPELRPGGWCKNGWQRKSKSEQKDNEDTIEVAGLNEERLQNGSRPVEINNQGKQHQGSCPRRRQMMNMQNMNTFLPPWMANSDFKHGSRNKTRCERENAEMDGKDSDTTDQIDHDDMAEENGMDKTINDQRKQCKQGCLERRRMHRMMMMQTMMQNSNPILNPWMAGGSQFRHGAWRKNRCQKKRRQDDADVDKMTTSEVEVDKLQENVPDEDTPVAEMNTDVRGESPKRKRHGSASCRKGRMHMNMPGYGPQQFMQHPWIFHAGNNFQQGQGRSGCKGITKKE